MESGFSQKDLFLGLVAESDVMGWSQGLELPPSFSPLSELMIISHVRFTNSI